jgi:hypothetical protein
MDSLVALEVNIPSNSSFLREVEEAMAERASKKLKETV